MYILENTTMLKNIIIGLSIASATALLTTGCSNESDVKLTNTSNGNIEKRAVDGGAKYPITNGKYTEYHVNTDTIGKEYGFGRTPTQAEVKTWNIDVMPHDPESTPMYDMKHGEVVLDEDGNPKKAEGSVEWGEELYVQQCQICHGDFGAGGRGYPPLSGGDGTTNSLKNQLMNPASENPGIEPPIKVIGTFWPYASTLFWYIQDAMPFPNPKSLSNSETYALTAYLLMENGITIEGEELDFDYVLDKEKFLKIKMPNEDGFYPNVDTPKNPHKGVQNMTKYLANPENYGTGTRCMTDCVKQPVENLVMRINQELDDFRPPASTKRDLPPKKETGTQHPGQEGYDSYGCATCHSNAAIGAPVVGNKESWNALMEKGIEKVYENGIQGINAMPPKGGVEMSDDEFKIIVDYMIQASK